VITCPAFHVGARVVQELADREGDDVAVALACLAVPATAFIPAANTASHA
jgi:hypothetical protein